MRFVREQVMPAAALWIVAGSIVFAADHAVVPPPMPPQPITKVARAIPGTAIASQQLLLHIKAIEAPAAELEKAGIKVGNDWLVLKPQVARKAFESLKQCEECRILAEPTMATVSGRAAYFHVGGEIPRATVPNQPQQFVKFGTELNCCAKLNKQQNVELDIRFSQTNLDLSLGVRDMLNVRLAVDTRIVVPLGHTAVLAHADAGPLQAYNEGTPAQSADKSGTTQASPSGNKVILLIRPELAEPLSQ